LKALKWNITPELSSKRIFEVKKFHGELCQDQRLSNGKHYFETQILYPCIDIVVTQLQVRFAGLNEIKDLFSCILNLKSVFKDEISIDAKKLADEFDNFNSAE